MRKASNKVSCNVVIDSKVNRNGMSKIYFRILQGKVKHDISTGIFWPKQFFDKQKQVLNSRHEGDSDVLPYNLLISEYKTIAHRLQLKGFLNKTSTSIADLIEEFEYIGKNVDFLNFMETEMQFLYEKQILEYHSYRTHKSCLNTLKKFWTRPTLPFELITVDFIAQFDSWAKKVHKVKPNTVAGYHKDIRKYLNRAKKKEYIVVNPYEYFPVAFVPGDRSALTQDELIVLYQLWKKNSLLPEVQETLRRVLFSCVTGLRISDSSQIKGEMIENNILTFIPHKGRHKGRILKIPLPQIACSLIEGHDEEEIFKPFSDQYINENLKVIAGVAGIKKRLTYHCARDTFGTIFVEMGGDVKILQELMGHRDIRTTMIYLKMADKRKELLMNNFDRFMIA
ncbi:phage integrase SAM-like domain-containing protein [Paradesertivirga mongoliensis]|uniref:Phage integrase SAM-like domain-containing protein n=1 Tax=Paradesertivirga mongoliensis TaxID=2100740 RepID=A0ABW4ZNS8_9SPHI|nr:site-specific integrase [Pedobacter mongoliensis]